MYDYIDKSERDIKSAKVLLEHQCGNDYVAFHCHQAVEKALKALIIKYKQQIIEGHSLIFLCKEASNIDKRFLDYKKDCTFVNQYYIETRYPAESPLIVSDDEAQECINIASRILDLVKNIINI
ncbi:MAG: HEPN domain-containing protein [Clostridiales bacterium]|nr:HEPN domain-containing protein [Clostridiales bacterium]